MRGPSATAAAALLLLLISSCAVPGALANGHLHRRAWLRLHRRNLQQQTPGAKNGTLGGGSSTGGKLCAKVTAGAPPPFNAAPATCDEFFKAPSPFIAAPADTKTVKYGQILGSGPYVIYDRDNKVRCLVGRSSRRQPPPPRRSGGTPGRPHTSASCGGGVHQHTRSFSQGCTVPGRWPMPLQCSAA